VFISIFFISIGMLLDPKVIFEQPWLVAGVTVGVVLLKVVCAAIAVKLLGYPLRVALLAAFALGGIGEFSFVLAKTGVASGLISTEFFQYFLATSVLSLLVSPFLITFGPTVATWLGLTRHDASAMAKRESEALAECGLSDHLIIVGFGPVGRYSARAAAAAGIPYLIIEMNPQTVRIERAHGERIYYGDASQDVVLEAAGIERARVLSVVIADPAGCRQIVQAARMLSPTIKIVARTRFQSEIQPLLDIGADEVIPEELETAIELLSRVLKTYLVPVEHIAMTARSVRADGYKKLREKNLESQTVRGIESYLSDIDISIIRVRDRPAMVGQSLATMALRTRHGVTVVALRRGGETILSPDPLEPLEMNDILIAVGQPQQLSGILRKPNPDALITPIMEHPA
jgi:CPA2 family monovalent cation:H+ antiporter-2